MEKKLEKEKCYKREKGRVNSTCVGLHYALPKQTKKSCLLMQAAW